jgi:subtilisin family serine protease
MSTAMSRLARALLPAAALLLADAALARQEGAPVILERDVTFVSDSGATVLLAEGNYYVRAGEGPPLVVAPEYEERTFSLAAVTGQHTEKLDEPFAESISGGEDAHHLILLLPDGRSIDATGSYSGVVTRDASPLDPKSVASYREAWAQWPPPGVTERTALEPLAPHEGEATVTWSEGFQREVVLVKFREGAAVRVPQVVHRSGERPSLGLDANLQGRMEREARLQRAALTAQQVEADLAAVNRILASESVEAWVPMVDRPERFLEAERHSAEQRTAQESGDLGNLYAIKLKAGADATAIANQLNALASVETAYHAPIPQPAQASPATPDFQPNQGYLKPAPRGIDAEYAWTRPGGKGTGVWFFDVEGDWRLDHEDLPPRHPGLNGNGGEHSGDLDDENHGTAVLGEVVAKNDGKGITGIAHEGRFNVASVMRKRSFLLIEWTTYNVAEAITAAASKLRRGDVILIEQHYPSGKNSGTCPTACGNCRQWGYVPMEYFVPEFIAIHNATARGIHVVEAAGNGGMDLDHSRYGREFDRTKYDSRAILVGASNADLTPACWSNFGSRVDVHAWGTGIMTLGYGDHPVPGASPTDRKRWYRRSFGGTSGASPIVTGAVMSIVGAQKAAGQVLLTPKEMRALLVATGTAQQAYNPPTGMAAETRNIGPQPDLKRALDRQVPPAASGSGSGTGSGSGS